MCDALIGTTSWSLVKKLNGLKKLTYSGGRGGIGHIVLNLIINIK